MSVFDDRRHGEEQKMARDEDSEFRITARRNRLLGEWAAVQMALSEAEAEAYAKSVVQADFEEAGDADVLRKVLGDLTSAGIDIDEAGVRQAMGDTMAEARRQISQGS